MILILVFLSDFNSIKVRLEQSTVLSISLYQKFQFHKGTIRTAEIYEYERNITRFQFHKGTIRTLLNNLMFIVQPNFNSIKVRLEPLFRVWRTWRRPFQFHKGTIRTAQGAQGYARERTFQFHKGTIRTQERTTPS